MMASVMNAGPFQASHAHGADMPAATTSSAFVVPAGAIFLELPDSEDEDDGIKTPEPITASAHVIVQPNLIIPLSNGQAVNAHQAEASTGPAGPSTLAALVDYSESEDEDEDMDESAAVMSDGSDAAMEDGSNADTSQSVNADNVEANVAGPSTAATLSKGPGFMIPLDHKLEWMRLRTEEQLSHAQIGERFGSSSSVVRNTLIKMANGQSLNDGRRTPRRVTQKDAREWVKLRKSGMTYSQIGLRFARTVQTIRGVILRTQAAKKKADVKTTGKRKRASTSEAPRQVKAAVETSQAAVESTGQRASAVEKQPTTSLATTSRATTSLATTLTKEQMKTIVEILREPSTDLETLCEAVEVDEATVKAAVKNHLYARITLELDVISHTPANDSQLKTFANSLGSSLAHLKDVVWIGQFDFALNSSYRMSLRETGPLVPNADAKLFSNQWELFAAVTKDTSIAVKDRLRSSGARKDWQVILDDVAAHLNSVTGERADLHPTVILEETVHSRSPYVQGSLVAAGWPVVVLPRDHSSLSPVQHYASSIHPIVQCTEQRTKSGTSPLSLRRHVEEEMANVPKATREEWFGQLTRALSKVSSSPISAASTSQAAPRAAAAATTIASSSTTQPIRGPPLPTITALKRLVKQEPDPESAIAPPAPREIKYAPLVNQLDSALGFSGTGTTQRLQDSSSIAANHKPSEEDKKKVGVTPWRVAAKKKALE